MIAFISISLLKKKKREKDIVSEREGGREGGGGGERESGGGGGGVAGVECRIKRKNNAPKMDMFIISYLYSV